jgi:hypothetical protein
VMRKRGLSMGLGFFVEDCSFSIGIFFKHVAIKTV